jgi:hypothetical protein
MTDGNAEPYNTRVWGRNQTASSRSLWVNQVFADMTAESTGATNIYNQYFTTRRGSLSDTSTTPVGQMIGVFSTVGHVYSGAYGTTANIVTNEQTAYSCNVTNALGTIVNSYAYKASSQVYNLTSQGINVTNYYAFYSDLFVGYPGYTAASVLTNYYGLFLNTPSVRGVGSIVNRWGVYAPDPAMAHYINGNLLLGTTTNTGLYKLDVNGAVRISGEVLVDNNISMTGAGSTRMLSISGYSTYLRLSASSSLGYFDFFKGIGYAQISSINEPIRYVSPSHLFGGTTYVASALVNLESTTQGFLPPRMTAAQKAAIVTPATGLIIYQTDATEGLYQYLSTGWSAVSSTGYLTINNPTYTGVLKSGTLTYTPSNALATLQTDVVGYNQFVIQNSDNGSFSSSDFVVSNDLSDDSTYYGDFGINSSQFSGDGSFALANAIYLYGSDGDLVLGTVTENDVHIVTNSSDVDSITALTTGQILFPHYTSNTSFTGTAAGIIGFTSAGALITLDASAIGSGTVTSVELAAGAGISLSGTNPITSSGIITVTNSAPDQVVTITQSGGGLTIEGTYPSFNLINSDKGSSQNIFKNIAVNAQTTITAGSNNETLTVTAGTGVTVGTNNTTKTLTITNSSPDQTVSLTAGTATTISGTYPNFTIGASYSPVNKAGDTMLGYLTLNGDPANPLHAATKQYVDSANSTSIHVHDPVRVETTANLTAIYTQGGTTHTVTAIATGDTLTIGAHSLVTNDVIVFNSTANGLTAGVPYFVYDAPSGTTIRLSELYAGAVKTNLTNGTGLSITSRANSGVGSTLTNAGAQAALVVDGVTVIVGDRVLVNAQTSSFQNGIYVVTNVGSGSTNWILTRSSDSNKYGISTPQSTNEGDYHFVQEGSTNGGKSYVLTTEGVIVFGTTAITFTQFTGSVSYTGGTNIDVNGQTISLTGQVGVANGGTGASTLTGVLIGNGTSAVTGVAGTASQILRRNSGNSAYEFFTPVYNSRTTTVVSANTTASAAANTDYVYLASGVTTITLPTAVGNTGKYTVKNTGTNTVTINTTSSQTIDGSTSVTIAVRYTALDFISDGSNWNII